MKFTAVATLSLVAATSAANLTIVSPWSSTVWKSGRPAEVTWTSATELGNQKCDIQMLNGDPKHANVVAYVTDPKSPVPCSANKFQIPALNDFQMGDYFLRMAPAKTGDWVYSGVFKFEGTGSAKIASGPVLVGATPAAASSFSSSPSSSSRAVSSSRNPVPLLTPTMTSKAATSSASKAVESSKKKEKEKHNASSSSPAQFAQNVILTGGSVALVAISLL